MVSQLKIPRRSRRSGPSSGKGTSKLHIFQEFSGLLQVIRAGYELRAFQLRTVRTRREEQEEIRGAGGLFEAGDLRK